jgi:hypothetical protein
VAGDQIVRAQQVVVVSLPGLLWSDVAAMPTLRGLMARGAVGSLTAKADGSSTRCLSGSLTFSAGNRALATGPGCDVPAGGWPSLRSANQASSYGASIGAFGSALSAAGVDAVATTSAARPMVSNQAGVVAPSNGSSTRNLAVTLDPVLSGVPIDSRRPADRSADQALAGALAGLPSGAVVIVTATADATTGGASLHPLVIAGPGWPHRELTFPGARAPYVETIDLAPTILQLLGIAVPATMVGKPLQVMGSRVQTGAAYADADRHARRVQSVHAPLLLTLGWLTILVLALAGLGRSEARVAARLLAPLPLLSFAVNLLPWWRWNWFSYVGILVAGCVLIAGAVTLLARRGAVLAGLAVPVVTLVVLAADQLAGAPMQLSSPLGYDPIGAGRFVGLGNLGFAAIAAAAIAVAALAGSRLSRRSSLLLAAGVLLVAVVIDVAPGLGDDAGGGLALIPAGAVVLAVLAGVRPSLARLAAVLGGAFALAVAIALADYSRPASSQTHVGRFVGQLLHGGAGTEVGRKAHAALATVGFTVSTAVVVACLVTGWLCRDRLRRTTEADAGVLALAAGAVTVAVLGSALNDSGLDIAAIVAAVAVSTAFSVQWLMRAPTRQDASSSAAAVTTTTATAATDSPDSPGR